MLDLLKMALLTRLRDSWDLWAASASHCNCQGLQQAEVAHASAWTEEGEALLPGCLLSRTIQKKGVLGSECLLPDFIYNLGKSSTPLNMLAANRTN